jgi:endonuclease/exonuclease/phosphatase family metal-dependent hydrolase
MPVKLITLNIEQDKHLERVIPFLEKEKADIICLQEVFASDFDYIRKRLSMTSYFCPMGYIDNKIYPTGSKKDGLLGMMILSNLICSKPKADYYENENCPILTPNGITDRILFRSAFYKNGEIFNVGNTHFTWSPKGEVSDLQKESFNRLKKILEKMDDFILCGDFNAPREKEVFNSFLKEGFRDNLPQNISSTIDARYHRNKNLSYAVDNIFSKGAYDVSNVRIADGLSDHKAIIGEISIKH